MGSVYPQGTIAPKLKEDLGPRRGETPGPPVGPRLGPREEQICESGATTRAVTQKARQRERAVCLPPGQPLDLPI